MHILVGEGGKKKSKLEEELLCTLGHKKYLHENLSGSHLAALALDSWKYFFLMRMLCMAFLEGTFIQRLLDIQLSHVMYGT